MTASLTVVSVDTPTDTMLEHLERDGAVIVSNALNPVQLAGMNADFDAAASALEPGLRNPSEPRMIEFYGRKTIRFDGLPHRSETFVDLLGESFMTRLADVLLLPNCQHYLLNTAQLIQIGPGESAQMLHRDEGAWRYFTGPKPLLQVEAMFALSDFTAENGGTRVVPGSHRWAPEREPLAAEITQAEMPAGSALVYLGTTLHGGGANQTADVWRRGMFFGLVVGWLRTEENMYLTVPFETVRRMPARAQELLGYRAHGGIGVVDVGCPSALFE